MNPQAFQRLTNRVKQLERGLEAINAKVQMMANQLDQRDPGPVEDLDQEHAQELDRLDTRQESAEIPPTPAPGQQAKGRRERATPAVST